MRCSFLFAVGLFVVDDVDKNLYTSVVDPDERSTREVSVPFNPSLHKASDWLLSVSSLWGLGRESVVYAGPLK